MSLRLRNLRIRVTTPLGPFGVDIPFSDGLNIVRADNTSGKSTCFQAILYAMGLDAMLTARQHQLPLTPALTNKVWDEQAESEVTVQATELWLEIEGADNQIATLYRPVVGLGDNRRITVFEGKMNGIDEGRGRQMFVRIPGAAKAEHGFHRWFAEDFLKWELPEVERNDGKPGQLYLETIFPLFFVEQRFGWSRIQGNMPYVFGIRDVARRAAEYVLGLSISETQLQRTALSAKLRELQARYNAIVRSVQGLATVSGSVVRGLPESLPDEEVSINLLVVQDGKWYELHERRASVQRRIEELSATMRQRREAASYHVLAAEQRRAELLELITERRQVMRAEAQERLALSRRRADLEEQHRKLTDLRALAKVGGKTESELLELHCPTCWQPVADSASPGTRNVLSLEETINFADGEIALLESTLAQGEERSRALRAALEQYERELETVDTSIEASRNASGDEANLVQATQYVEYRHELQTLDRLTRELATYVDDANKTIIEGRKVKTAISVLRVGLSERDQKKLSELEDAFRAQEREYAFKSFGIDELSISRETYKPTVQGFELSFETSASDGIRTIWSYLFGLLELGRSYRDTHHIGALLFDEPRQQNTNEFSFGQLLRHAALASPFGEQVVFFTSDEPKTIRRELTDSKYKMTEFAGKMIARL